MIHATGSPPDSVAGRTLPGSADRPAAVAQHRAALSPAASRPRFSGIIPPLVTPLLDPDTLDPNGLERLVNHVLGGGVHGLFLLGTTGEGPALSGRLQRDLIERAVAIVAGRVPVLVGITDASPAESLELAGFAATAGADAVVAAPPYYFPAGQEPLIRWALDLADRSPLPLVLYNMPEMTKLVLEPATLERLAACERIVGLKDSSGDLGYFAAAAASVAGRRPDWSLLVGPEQLLPEAEALGGHGAIPGGANVWPRLFVEFFDAVQAADAAALARTRGRVAAVSRLYRIGRLPGGIIVGIKAALAALGICRSVTAGPFEQLDTEQRREVERLIEDLGPTVGGTPGPAAPPP
jgi:dihydrodipicolinate synthase/N-acetylneuraminate lyase